jgi:hypothetical protein
MKFYNIEMGSSLDVIRQNFLINGNFDFWQRGTEFTLGTNNQAYTADRWKYVRENSTSGQIRIDRSIDVPSLIGKYSLQGAPTVSVSSINSNEVYYIGQIIEGYSTLPLMDKVCTLSFWVKTNKPGIYSVAFQNSTQTRSYVSSYTVNSSNVWEKKVISLTVSSSGVWNFTDQAGLRILFVLACGSSLIPSPNTWVTNPYYGVTGQVNFLDSLSNTIKFAGVKFELGLSDTSGMGRSIATELTMCQRYFEKSYELHMDPGSVETAGAVVSKIINETISVEGNFKFSVCKRSIPYVFIFSPDTSRVPPFGTAMYCRNRSNSTDQLLTLIPNDSGYVGCSGFGKFNVSPQTNFSIITFHWVAYSEIEGEIVPPPT